MRRRTTTRTSKLAALALVALGATVPVIAWLATAELDLPGVPVPRGPVAASDADAGTAGPRAASSTVARPPRAEVSTGLRTATEEPTATAPAEIPTGAARSPSVAASRAPARIAGHVTTPSGLALEAVMVSAAPDDRRRGTKVWTRTDASGRFELEVPERFDVRYRVQVAGTTEDRSLRRLIQTLKASGELRVDGVLAGREDLEFRIPVPGNLVLIPIDRATGLGLPGLRVESRPPGDGDFRPHGWGLQRIPPDDEGRFTIGLPAGPIVLRLTEPGYQPLERSFVVPATTEPLPAVVEFDRCARIELTVVPAPGSRAGDYHPRFGRGDPRDELGRPIYAATVLLLTDDEHRRYRAAKRVDRDDAWVKELLGRLEREGRRFEDEDGRLVAWPPPGRYRFAALPRSSRFVPEGLTVERADRGVTVEVRPGRDPGG